jgi:hypothetical protein
MVCMERRHRALCPSDVRVWGFLAQANKKNKSKSQACMGHRGTPIIPALRRLRQKGLRFQAS